MGHEMTKRILIVEDEKDILTPIKAWLAQSGYDIVVAYEGLEGLEKAQKEQPDLILVDVSIPRMNGYQMVQLLRQYEMLKETPVVVITASRQKDEAAWRTQVGVEHFILKPFETKELLDKVREALLEKSREKA